MSKRDYNNWTKENLIKEIEKLRARKKYGIVWEDKTEQIAELCKERLPVLVKDKEKEIITTKETSVNILIEGDNYHALSILNYTHKGKVDVIYIDPPYNTGNKDFIYNDRYVDSEDAYRHSKWLSFMSKRLKLAKNVLSNKGVIFISIDDNELAQLKLLVDEIFGEKNFIANFVRIAKGGGGNDSSLVAVEYDYVLCYGKNKKNIRFNKEIVDINDPKYKYEDEFLEKRGKYYLRDLEYKGSYSETLDYPIEAPDKTILYSGGRLGKPFTWRWSKEKVRWGGEHKFIVVKKVKERWKVYIKQYQFVDNNDQPRVRNIPFRALIDFKNSLGAQTLNNILQQQIFQYPKPVDLIKYLINLYPDKNVTILDFMAGTGTTGHAVLELNKYDGGNRKFILVTNNENAICTDVCYPRIEKIIKDFGGNLKYFKTDFVDAKATDANKKKLVNESTEMLCLKEDCFDKIKEQNTFRVYTNNKNKFLGIIYDDDGIEPFKKELKKINKKFVVYVFSLDDSAREEEFEDVAELVELRPIPAVILNVYKQIFK